MQPFLVLAVLGGSDCERVGAGWLAQPANAISSLAYVAVGGWLLGRARRPDTDRILLLTAGTAMAGVGLGSVGYHGPQPAWAEMAHDGSIAWVGLVLGGNALWRLPQRNRRRAAGRLMARRGWAAVAWVAAALLAYAMGRTGSRLCRPESLWQFHAAWHVLSALGLGAAVAGLAGSPGAARGLRADS